MRSDGCRRGEENRRGNPPTDRPFGRELLVHHGTLIRVTLMFECEPSLSVDVFSLELSLEPCSWNLIALVWSRDVGELGEKRFVVRVDAVAEEVVRRLVRQPEQRVEERPV